MTAYYPPTAFTGREVLPALTEQKPLHFNTQSYKNKLLKARLSRVTVTLILKKGRTVTHDLYYNCFLCHEDTSFCPHAIYK